MKDGANKSAKNLTKVNRPEPYGEFLRRPNKLQPTGKDKYRPGKSSRWQDDEDELDEDFDLFGLNEEDEDLDDEA